MDENKCLWLQFSPCCSTLRLHQARIRAVQWGKGPLLSFQCNGQSIQACADMPVLACAFCFCLLFVLTAAHNYIILLQKYFWEMGIFESTEVIGGRCRFPPPTPLHHFSVQIQTAFLPHSPLKLKRLKFFTRKVILSWPKPCLLLPFHLLSNETKNNPESAHQPTSPTQKLSITSPGGRGGRGV